MSSYQNRTDDEEDEDLEFLRLAALKSLATRKEPIINSSHVVPTNKIQVLESHSVANVYVPQTAIVPEQNVNTYNPSRQLQQLDINEPYVPQTLNRNGQWVDESCSNDYVPYIPSRPGAPHVINPNVQLSPRSAAFVLENNQILEQRKKSPANYHRSPSYRFSPERWSVSPPAKSHRYMTRRSRSRSPSPLKQRSISRSPTRRYNSRASPLKRVMRKSRSRSPGNRYYNRRSRTPQTPPSRKISPVPLKSSNYLNKNRSFSPNNKRQVSPSKGRPHAVVPKWDANKNRKSISPSRASSNYNVAKQRSSSPYNKKRSRSPSSRQYNANKIYNSDNNKRYNKNGIHQGNGRYQPTRPNYDSSFSQNTSSKPTSPVRKRQKTRSRSKTPIKILGNKVDPIIKPEKSSEDFQIKKDTKVDAKASTVQNSTEPRVSNVEATAKEIIADKKIKTLSKVPEKTSTLEECESSTPPPTSRMKTQEELEDELLASTDDEKDSSEDELDDEDEIDLFASEESESENEGRFKSSSTSTNRKPDKPATTVSFTKLGVSSTSAVKDLNSALPSSLSGRDKDRDRRDRNRDSRRNDDNYNSDRRRRDYNSYNSRHKSSNTTKVETKSETRKDESRNMFKPTFKTVESEPKKTNTDEPKTKKIEFAKEKSEAAEKRSILQLKRPTTINLKQVKSSISDSNSSTATKSTLSTDNAAAPEASTTSSLSSTVSNTAVPTTTKKAIHLRLGPSTTTANWKNKKSWRQEKV